MQVAALVRTIASRSAQRPSHCRCDGAARDPLSQAAFFGVFAGASMPLILVEAGYLQGVAAVAVTVRHDRDRLYTFLFAAFFNDPGDKRGRGSIASQASVRLVIAGRWQGFMAPRHEISFAPARRPVPGPIPNNRASMHRT